MGLETVLDGKYTQIPSGWKSAEVVEYGTVRFIQGTLHYAGAVYDRGWFKKGETLWWVVKGFNGYAL